jgi:hypothetical protein
MKPSTPLGPLLDGLREIENVVNHWSEISDRLQVFGHNMDQHIQHPVLVWVVRDNVQMLAARLKSPILTEV